MKAIVLIGVISLVALGIFAVLSLMQRQATGEENQCKGKEAAKSTRRNRK